MEGMIGIYQTDNGISAARGVEGILLRRDGIEDRKASQGMSNSVLFGMGKPHSCFMHAMLHCNAYGFCSTGLVRSYQLPTCSPLIPNPVICDLVLLDS